MADKYLLKGVYNCSSAKEQWFVTFSKEGFGIGAAQCPFYGTDTQDCEDDGKCGEFRVLEVMAYSALEAGKHRAIDLTQEEEKDKGLTKMVGAAT